MSDSTVQPINVSAQCDPFATWSPYVILVVQILHIGLSVGKVFWNNLKSMDLFSAIKKTIEDKDKPLPTEAVPLNIPDELKASNVET
jgi:hypothetical protein